MQSNKLAFNFPSSKKKTTITTTTTTTTTVNFPPLILPNPNQTKNEEQENKKTFPLIQTEIPKDWLHRGIPLVYQNGSSHVNFYPHYDQTHIQSCSNSRKRSSCYQNQITENLEDQSKKKVKLDSSNNPLEFNSINESKSNDLDQIVHPLQSENAQLEFTTVLSLPHLSNEFSKLSINLQQYTLFNLLKLSKLPTLQFVQSMIEPALKRDFIKDLPIEISILILNKLSGSSLCLASQVSKNWHRIIQTSRSIWKHRLMVEDLWIGDGSEDLDAEECKIIQNLRKFNRNVDLEMNRFSRLWRAGTWNKNQNLHHSQLPLALKKNLSSFSSSKFHLDQSIIHPSFSNINNNQNLSVENQIQNDDDTIQESSNRTRSPNMNNLNQNEKLIELQPDDPFKLLYRKRFLTRLNWMKKEPKRMSFPGHALTVVTCIQFDWFRVVAASDDNAVYSYSLKTGRRLQSFIGHQGGIWALQYVGDTLVTGSTDRTIRVWDMKTGRNTHVFHGHTSTVRCLQIVEPINLNQNKLSSRNSSLHDREEPIWEPAYPIIVTGSRDNTLRVWKLPSNLDEEFIGFPTPGSPDETNGMIPNHTIESNTSNMSTNPFHLHFLQGHHNAVRALAAKGRTMVSGSYDCTVRSWDIITGECKQIMTGHQQKIYSVVLDETRGRCASGSMDNTVRLWDLETGNTIKILGEHSSLVGLLGLSPTKLVSAAADATLRVYEPTTGACKFELKGHLGAITCFVHDEFRVVSGSDGTLKLWNNSNGSFVSDLLTGYSAIWQVSMDERFCVVAVQRGDGSEYVVLDYGRNDGFEDSHLDLNPLPNNSTTTTTSFTTTTTHQLPPELH